MAAWLSRTPTFNTEPGPSVLSMKALGQRIREEAGDMIVAISNQSRLQDRRTRVDTLTPQSRDAPPKDSPLAYDL